MNLLAAASSGASNHWEGIATSLKGFFYAIGVFWLMVSWIARFSSGKEASFQLLKFSIYLMMIIMGMYYYSNIINGLFEATNVFSVGFRDITDNMRTALFQADVDGVSLGYFALGAVWLGTGLIECIMALMLFIFSIAQGILIVIAPMMLPMLAHKTTEQVGAKFITLTISIGLIPIGIAFADYMGILCMEYVLNLGETGSGESYLLDVISGQQPFDPQRSVELNLGTGFLVGVSSFATAGSAIMAPMFIGKLLAGVGPWVATMSGAKAAAQVASSGASAGSAAVVNTAKNSAIQRGAASAAGAATTAVAGAGKAIMAMAGVGGNKSSQNADDRSINNHRK